MPSIKSRARRNRAQLRGIAVRRYRKPTITRIAPTALKQQIAAECNLVIEGFAD